MSSAITLDDPHPTPIISMNWSLNEQSWFLNGRFAQFSHRLWSETLASVRIVVALLCAMTLEWYLAPLGFAGQAPVPVVASVVACYVLTSSYGRMVVACVAAGLIHDAFMPVVPLGCSGLIYLAAAVVGRELRDEERGGGIAEQVLVSLLIAGAMVLLSHVMLVVSGVSGSASLGEVLRRVLGSALVAAFLVVPLARVAKVAAGRCFQFGLRLSGLGAARLGAWVLRHLNLPERQFPRMPQHPLPAEP